MTISDSGSDVGSVDSYESEFSSDEESQASEQRQPEIPRVLANWWLNENLGSGYSGSIFRATHVHTGQVVALKVQHVNHECPTNRYERHLYPLLQEAKGMPRLFAAGVQGEWDYLAIDLLGASLDNIYRKNGKEVLDLRSVCSIAEQVIDRLELMHNRGVLHRDIQLGNCVIGLPPNEKTIYMIDFGFSKRYIDPYTNRHIPDSKVKRDFIGNYWFSSVNVHCRGKVPSRRDDLEAAALMFIHLLTPRGLSWTRNGVPKTTDAHNRLMAEKRAARPEDLCRGLPDVFEEFLHYSRSLKFKDCPNYTRWKQEFRDLAVDQGYPDSDEFVWPPPAPVAPIPKSMNTPRRHTPAVNADEMEGILNDLGKLNFGEQQVLGDRTNVQEAVRQAKKDAQAVSGKQSEKPSEKDVIVVSSGSEGDSIPPPFLTPKAHRLEKLARRASQATDNAGLSKLVHEFIEVMQSNSSRTLTKEAFHFLDVLYKQLEDPSVFIQPMRTSRTRSVNNEPIPEKEPAHIKLGVVARLKREVGQATNNKALAAMVNDFGRVTNKSAGRTVTKDGFAFLEGLAERLTVLH
ncbi:kinase-like domain-containing protein [Crucibulum laeve]|uniref:Kinase-like domain-containing protein n=1 Tax=Crucibulum laeve TaxID=68775 RepID=A0A5C3M7D4_9AGAR|nr:kinase-like domain-containing protein [Crucibulum laeve]